MALKPKPSTQPPLPVIRDLAKQIASLAHTLRAFEPSEVHARAWATEHLQEVPAGYAGIIAVPTIDNFGIFQIPASCEAWGKVAGWSIHTKVPGIKTGGPEKFDPGNFKLEERTKSAFARLNQTQSVAQDGYEMNRLRIFPIRFSSDPSPALGENEFFLDLSSLIWLLISHPKWKETGNDLILRCLGERYMKSQEILVGYRDYARSLHALPEHTSSGIVAIGLVP